MSKTARRFAQLAAGAAGLGLAGYGGYLFHAFYRLPPEEELTVGHNRRGEKLAVNTPYQAQTFNIGYGSYPPDYTFFMAGGKESRARSRQSVLANVAGVIETTKDDLPDFAFFQEVDTDGDRSQHVDEVAQLTAAFAASHSAVYGQNYDSPYLFFPFTHPIGKAKSGLVTLIDSAVTQAERYSLPIDTNLEKFTDLDRAFTVSFAPVANGHFLRLVNVHLSAFTHNQKVQQVQFDRLFDYIAKAYAAGDYVLVAGDYNHTLLPDSAQVFGQPDPGYTWTHPFPHAELPAGFTVPLAGIAEAKVPSIRYMDQPYVPGKSFVSLIDGFIVSPNITVQAVHVVDAGFAHSDHNPVRLTFKLRA